MVLVRVEPERRRDRPLKGRPTAGCRLTARALVVVEECVSVLVLSERAGSRHIGPGGACRLRCVTPFHERVHGLVIPGIRRLLERFRCDGHEVLFARIACQTRDGRDRSLSQKLPRWNNLLLPKDEWDSQIIEHVACCGMPAPPARMRCIVMSSDELLDYLPWHAPGRRPECRDFATPEIFFMHRPGATNLSNVPSWGDCRSVDRRASLI